MTTITVAGMVCAALWGAEVDEWTLRPESPQSVVHAEVSDDIPGPFLYDPIARKSRQNTASWKLDAGRSTTWPAPAWRGSGSFTLEAFVKPLSASDSPYVVKTRRSRDAATAGLKLDHFHAHNQFYFRAFAVPVGGDHTVRPWVGYYGSSAQYQGEKDVAWRHLAMVYDAERRTLASYIDYYLSNEVPLTEPMTFDEAPLQIGGSIAALIDEIRYLPRAASPGEFLRAVSHELSGVSFISDQTIVPRDAGCIDVKEHFGAAGDGTTDDTDAFQRAFDALCSRVPLAYHTLLIPPGTYLISRTVQGGRFIDVKGAGPERTILKLKDGVFQDPTQPTPVLRMSSSRNAPGANPHVNGSSISIYLDGLTIDTGKNNPGSRGIEYHSNNLGRLENVVIRSGDGAGVCGLDLTHHDCGPALVKHVAVEGFDYGIQSRYQEYSMTFEHVQLRNQRKAGVFNQGNILAIRKLTSENRVPAIVCEGANSMVTLLDSSLTGGAGDQPAIQTDGAMYALRVETGGYREAIAGRTLTGQNPAEWEPISVQGPNLREYSTRPAVSGFGTGSSDATGSLKLPIEETPEPPVEPIEEWVNVRRFQDRVVQDDWGPAVQAAIDSGARVIYVPANMRLRFKTPVVIRGQIHRLVGFGGEFQWHGDVWQSKGDRQQTDRAAAPPPLILYDDPREDRTVWIDRLGVQCLRHAGRGALVLRSSSPGRYETGAAGGRLFAEDVGGADWHFDHPQSVWVRQWNPESHAAGPCIHSRGASIWALGFKTEYESQKMLAEAGASTEILGGFIYPIGKIPSDRPIFENRDSRLTLVYGVSVYQSNHAVHVRDTRREETVDFGNDRLRWAGSRAKMELFTTDGR